MVCKRCHINVESYGRCCTVFASVSRSVRAAASTDCFLSDSGFWLLGVGIRLGGERHPDHNGGVPSSPLWSSKLTCRKSPLAVVPQLPVP